MNGTSTIVKFLALALAILLQARVIGIDLERNKSLEAAFVSIVKEPTRSTVQVYCDGYKTSLGAVVRPDGYIVTKASEIKGKVQCELNGHEGKLDATVVGTDVPTDVALLKVNAGALLPVTWGELSPAVGSWLATPGLGTKPVAVGVLSVGPRKLDLQPALGIGLDDSDDMARINEVFPGMAAQRAGLQAGDIVRRLDGKEIRTRGQLQEAIKAHQVGDHIELLIERGGEQMTKTATLGSKSQFGSGERAEFQNGLGGKLSDRRLGFPMVLQHDSVLDPKNCGGPLVDLDGKTVGINIARAGRIESYALPAAVVRETVAKLMAAKGISPTGTTLVDKTVPAEDEKKVH